MPRPKKSVSRSSSDKQHAGSQNMQELQENYSIFENSKIAVLAHVASQHSILDVLYGGDVGRPMPSWTYQTSPEVGVSDQQHTGRCWIFASLAVLGHVFRSQYGISNSRATFSEGYLGFWDLYEKSRLFLQVAFDTRHLPLNEPSLCDLLKNGISDGGDFIFCLNLMDRYGIVPTEYYPNSSYGSMSTEALVTLINQVLRDNAITLRASNGHQDMIPPMLTNIFSLLCIGLGTPPAPWKKMDWHLDQHEMMAQFSVELPPTHIAAAALPIQRQAIANITESTLPAETVAWRPSVPKSDTAATYPVKIPPKPAATPSSSSAIDDLVAALSGPTAQTRTLQPEAQVSTTTASGAEEPSPPPSPVNSTMTAANPFSGDEEDQYASTTKIINELPTSRPGEIELQGSKPPRKTEEIPSLKTRLDIGKEGDCKSPSGFSRIVQGLTPRGCSGGGKSQPEEGSGDFFQETMPDSCHLRGRQPKKACRLAHTICEFPAKFEKPREEEAMTFDYTPRDFYYRFLNGVRFVPMVCDRRFPSGTRIISNDANMYGGLASIYLNVSIDDIEEYVVASLKRNIPVWFACDVKKQLTPEGGRMCIHTDRLAELLPEPHKIGTKLEEIKHFNAVANHALIISAVSMKSGKPNSWRIVNSWGDVGRNSGIFVACGKWFREHVYSINAVYDTLSRQHKADVNSKNLKSAVRLGPFDPSVI